MSKKRKFRIYAQFSNNDGNIDYYTIRQKIGTSWEYITDGTSDHPLVFYFFDSAERYIVNNFKPIECEHIKEIEI